jgi:copper chaperone NosL
VALAIMAAVACGGGGVRPAALDTRNDACGWCRMVVSDARFAAQLVAPSEEPVFFDDVGCLASYLKGRPLPKGAVAYVADHRTREWTVAARAVYARAARLATPMGSHLVAHASVDSRAADPDAAAAAAVPLADVFGPGGAPGGER